MVNVSMKRHDTTFGMSSYRRLIVEVINNFQIIMYFGCLKIKKVDKVKRSKQRFCEKRKKLENFYVYAHSAYRAHFKYLIQ